MGKFALNERSKTINQTKIKVNGLTFPYSDIKWKHLNTHTIKLNGS